MDEFGYMAAAVEALTRAANEIEKEGDAAWLRELARMVNVIADRRRAAHPPLTGPEFLEAGHELGDAMSRNADEVLGELGRDDEEERSENA